MGVTPTDLDARTSKVLGGLIKGTRIHLDGTRGMRDFATAWKQLLQIKKRYWADIVPRVLVGALLHDGVQPMSARLAIQNLQKGGTNRDKLSYSSMSEFHFLLVRLARVAKTALQLGLVSQTSSKARARPARLGPCPQPHSGPRRRVRCGARVGLGLGPGLGLSLGLDGGGGGGGGGGGVVRIVRRIGVCVCTRGSGVGFAAGVRICVAAGGGGSGVGVGVGVGVDDDGGGIGGWRRGCLRTLRCADQGPSRG